MFFWTNQKPSTMEAVKAPVEQASNIVAPIERLFLALPMGSSPLGRTLLAGGTGLGLAYALRPSFSFDAKGKPRPWIVFDQRNPEATIFPLWAFFVVPGLIFGVFL